MVAVAVVWIVPSFRAKAVHVFARLYAPDGWPAQSLTGAASERSPDALKGR
jgi:hypothetical protein